MSLACSALLCALLLFCILIGTVLEAVQDSGLTEGGSTVLRDQLFASESAVAPLLCQALPAPRCLCLQGAWSFTEIPAHKSLPLPGWTATAPKSQQALKNVC